MTAYTASQTGNWSESATWGGAGVPGSGDTATIGAYTVTVDTNTTVGTSPNDTTTKVIDLTSASSKLIVAAGITLTVLGNMGGVNSSTFQQEAGSTVTFDNSSSGGSPIYTIVNVGFTKYVFNGTSANRCTLQAISGQAHKLNGAWNSFSATYTDFVRCNFLVTNAAGGAAGTSITFCTFDGCSDINITSNSATIPFTFEDNRITNTVHSIDSLKIASSVAATTGTRSIRRNSADKEININAATIYFDDNFFGGATCYTGMKFARPPRNNMLDNTQNLNGGNGMKLNSSWDGLYAINSISSGNPHFIAPQCDNSADETYSRCIFESNSPDLVDSGDCLIGISTFCSSGNKLVVKHAIVLPNADTGVTSGQLVTSFNPPTATAATHNIQVLNTTVNQDKSAIVGARAAIAFAESAVGFAGQISSVKSNIVWASGAGNGYIAERISGTVDGIITAANCDYNWRYNIDDGDNGRGYEDRANSPGQDLWDTGNADGSDAAAAGVDANQGSGNPQFVDSARGLAKWCFARGYGAQTWEAGKAAIQADPTRIADLIDYVFEGFKVTNASCRTAGHDGGAVGAANWHNTARDLTNVTTIRTNAASNYGVSV